MRGLIRVAVVCMQCIYAVIGVTSQDAVVDPASNPFDIGRPIAVVAVKAPFQPGFDSETPSFYVVEGGPEISAQQVDSAAGESASSEKNELKRTLGMLRMGRTMRQREDEKRSMGMLRMGKKSMGMLRMGRSGSYSSDESNEDKRSMGMLRMGRSSSKSDANDEKRSMGMLRMGRSSGDGDLTSSSGINEEKKSMAMLRMGKKR